MTKIIAEIGQNHLGNKDKFSKLINEIIDVNKLIGDVIIKFQYWNVDSIYSKLDCRYDAAKAREINFPVIIEAILKAKQEGLKTCCSFFGATNIEKKVIIELVDYIKYASSEYDVYVDDRAKGLIADKPVILSDGFYNFERKYPNEIILSCNPEYPSKVEDAINRINFNKHDGISDHCVGLDTAEYAIKNNCLFFEKHYCLVEDSNSIAFRDFAGSMNKNQLVYLIDYIKNKDTKKVFKTFNNKRNEMRGS